MWSQDAADQSKGAWVTNAASGQLAREYAYGYDAAGNRTSEQVNLSVAKAGYNNLNQLLTLTNSGPVRFRGSLSEPGTVTVAGIAAAMDPGNRVFAAEAELGVGTNVVPVVAEDYSANRRTNQYQVVITNATEVRTLRNDLNGNLVSMSGSSVTNRYEWDAADRLVAIERGTNRWEFVYDGMGRRVRSVDKVNGVTVADRRWLWEGLALGEERDSTGATVQKRFFGQGEQIGGTNLYYVRDHLGSVREVTDAAGNVRAPSPSPNFPTPIRQSYAEAVGLDDALAQVA